jgi:hypothetical protein
MSFEDRLVSRQGPRFPSTSRCPDGAGDGSSHFDPEGTWLGPIELIIRAATGRTVSSALERPHHVRPLPTSLCSPGQRRSRQRLCAPPSNTGSDSLARWTVVHSPVGWGGICQFGQPGQETSLRNKAYFPPAQPRFWIWPSISQGIASWFPRTPERRPAMRSSIDLGRVAKGGIKAILASPKPLKRLPRQIHYMARWFKPAR